MSWGSGEVKVSTAEVVRWGITCRPPSRTVSGARGSFLPFPHLHRRRLGRRVPLPSHLHLCPLRFPRQGTSARYLAPESKVEVRGATPCANYGRMLQNDVTTTSTDVTHDESLRTQKVMSSPRPIPRSEPNQRSSLSAISDVLYSKVNIHPLKKASPILNLAHLKIGVDGPASGTNARPPLSPRTLDQRGPGEGTTWAAMEASREVEGHPSLRKACGVLVRDALFLSLLGDPHSRLLAEERMSEASVPHFPSQALSSAEFRG